MTGRVPEEIRGTEERLQLVDQEVIVLLKKGAIVEVDFSEDRFYSRMFLVPKKGNKWRPVLDLRSINKYIYKKHFKQEGVHTLRNTIKKDDWMIKIDLSDAYLHVPVRENFQRFLCFTWGESITNSWHYLSESQWPLGISQKL